MPLNDEFIRVRRLPELGLAEECGTQHGSVENWGWFIRYTHASRLRSRAFVLLHIEIYITHHYDLMRAAGGVEDLADGLGNFDISFQQ